MVVPARLEERMSLLGGFNWLDLVILLLLIVSLGIGYVQGLLRQIIGLAALYIATILGTQYHTILSGWIRFIIFQPSPSKFLNALSFFIIVFVVWSVISWLVYDVYRSAKLRLFPLIDQLGGSIIGLVTAVCAITMILPVIAFAVSEPWPWSEAARFSVAAGLQTSRLVSVFDSFKYLLLNAIGPWLPAGLPSIFNL